ncbi:Transmembrane protein [Parasponia andersonii]|uniref:Transmembrane protein n=1 Tax=Parasponia andersonii TaxID=3476 RepID=A0A2P5DU71_PARAD|nr:Transmembrane protein [Parasponia andersonii]
MAQGRAPHGLANEYPIVFSPSAYDFFHPTTIQNKPNTDGPCAKTSCSPLPMAAQVEATGKAQESKIVTHQSDRPSLGAGGIAGIVFGFAFAVLLAMAVYYVVVTRRENTSRAKSAQPDA